MNPMTVAYSLITLGFAFTPRMADAAAVVPVPAGPAFYALPLAGWGAVVQNLHPIVQSQAQLNPRLLPLQSLLGRITLRLSENELGGLESMEFVRFMPKTYRERPEAFAKLNAERQIASLSRGVHATTRALNAEAAELTDRMTTGKATAADTERLGAILGNAFYLSPAVRLDVEKQFTELASADSTHPALRRLQALLAEAPMNHGAAFDNSQPPRSTDADPLSAVSVPTTHSPLPRASGLAPSRAKSHERGEPMKTGSKKATAKRKAAPRGNGGDIKARIIKALGLEPLPGEGGYFRETYRSPIQVPVPSKNGDEPVTRHLGTAIYYFVTPTEFSALHKLKSDEVFHFYGGDPVEMLQITDTGEVKTIILGPNILEGQQVQVTVPAGTWQGTRLLKGGTYALLGTTVFPAFEFSDFELGKRSDLSGRFPQLAAQIKRFTRE